MSHIEPELKIADFVTKISGVLIEYIRHRYNAPRLRVIVKLDFRKSRTISTGGINEDGKPEIDLVCWGYIKGARSGRTVCETEYKSIADDPVIGSINHVDWKTGVATLVAHELAHVIQYHERTALKAKEIFGNHFKTQSGHSKFWQEIYRDLRRICVNGIDFNRYYPKPKYLPETEIIIPHQNRKKKKS